MDGWLDGWMDLQIDRQIDRSIDRSIDGQMDRWIDGATRSSYARADRLAAMLLAQNLHVRARLGQLDSQVARYSRYVVKKKRDSQDRETRQIDRWIAKIR